MGTPEPTTPPLKNDSTFSDLLRMELATPLARPAPPGVKLPDLSEETDGEALASSSILDEETVAGAALGVE